MDEQEAGLPKFPQPESELPKTSAPERADSGMNEQSVSSVKKRFNISPLTAFLIFLVSELLRSATHGFSTIGLFVDPNTPVLIPGVLLLLSSIVSLPRVVRLLMSTFALLVMSSNIFSGGSVSDIFFNLISLVAVGLSLRSTVSENALVGDQVSPTAPTYGDLPMSYKNPETQKTSYPGWLGWALLAASPIFAFSPFIIGGIGAQLTCEGGLAAANEGNCGWAALPWAMIMTIPGGILMAVVGLVLGIVSAVRKA
jgi:hypothetical protein